MVDMVNFTVAPTGSIMANSSLPFTISMGPGNVYKQMGMLTVSPISTAVVIGKFANFNSLIASTSTGTLTGGTYNISGTFKFDNANIVTNAANIILSGQIVDQNNVNALLNFANNSLRGSFTLTGGQNLTTPGTFSNAGKLIVAKGSRFSIGGSTTSYNQTSGTTTVDGALAVPVGGMVNLTGGTLAGAGTLSGNVSVGNTSGAGGTFIIGDSIKKAAPISITNNYTQLVTGAMDVQIGGTTAGTRYSQLNITGTAALVGTLNIAVINNFKPTIGQTFTILNASTGITGTFSTVNGTAINANEHFSVSYTSDTVVLTVVSGP